MKKKPEPKKQKKQKRYPKHVHQSWLTLRSAFRRWKSGGKNCDQNNLLYTEYRKARSNFQRIRKKEKDLNLIKQNNTLMSANKLNSSLSLSLFDIFGHYRRRYRLTFGPEKTEVTVTGSKVDMNYYKDISLWTLNGQSLTVSEDNNHLGLVVSGIDEEIKNVDKNIIAARKALFG